MTKTTLLAGAALVLALLSPGLVQAKSIKALMSPDQLASYCTTAGAGTSNTTITVGGKSVSGSVTCTANDMKVAANDTGESETGSSEAAENGKED